MRGGRALLVLAVVALGLGAYIYFVESKRDVDAGEAKEKVFKLAPGRIDEVEVRAASGDVTKLKKTGDDWQLVAPFTGEAEQGTASSIASSLETLEIQKVLEEKPSSFTPYGLDPARFTVTFKAAGDAGPHTLAVGNKTPTGSDIYARVEGQPRLLLISGFLQDTFNRTTFDLRNKTLLKFDRDAVDSITEEFRTDPTLVLKRQGSEWKVTAPITVRADLSPVDGVISRVVTAAMTGIVKDDGAPPTAKDLAAYGLDRPQLVVTFGAGSTRAVLAIGNAKDDKNLYARDLSRPLVFTVENTLLSDIKRGPGDVRVREVFEFKSFTATSLDITMGGTSYSFAKAPTPADATATAPDLWKETKPETKDMNATAMTDFLNTVSTLRATSFDDKAMPTGEEVIVAARFGDAPAPKEERVVLRKANGVAHAIRTGEPGAAVIPTADFDKAVSTFKALTSAK